MLTCKVYVIYLKEHIDALVEFENMLLCDERLSKEIARCEAQVGVKLRALLTKPVERPWYYAHVVQVIFNNYLPKSKQSTQALTACVSKSTNLTNELEIMVQQITQIKQIASLQRSFIQLPAPFLHQDQRIIQERSIQFRRYRKTNWQRCTYWLLSDRIIIGREKDESTYVCEVCIPLNRCIVSADTNCSEPFVGLLQINGISPMFQVQLESSGTFNYWISQLETAISQSKDDDAQINIPCGHGCLPRSTDPFFPDFHNFSIISPKNIG
ncbi:hypothetical protein BDF19DRAFT_18883 [Syncephalis fuscata]|nr:hypothetical protein BDF19DRAFT_18883 [Syncephalis fuscata]